MSYPLGLAFTREPSDEQLNRPGFLISLAEENVPFEVFHRYVLSGMDVLAFPEDEQKDFIEAIVTAGDFYILDFIATYYEYPWDYWPWFDSANTFGKYYISGIFPRIYVEAVRRRLMEKTLENSSFFKYLDRFYHSLYEDGRYESLPTAYELAEDFRLGNSPIVEARTYIRKLKELSEEFTPANLEYFKTHTMYDALFPGDFPNDWNLDFPVAKIFVKSSGRITYPELFVKKALLSGSPSAATLIFNSKETNNIELFNILTEEFETADTEYVNLVANWIIENMDVEFLTPLFLKSQGTEVNLTVQMAMRDKAYEKWVENGKRQNSLESCLLSYLYEHDSRMILGLPNVYMYLIVYFLGPTNTLHTEIDLPQEMRFDNFVERPQPVGEERFQDPGRIISPRFDERSPIEDIGAMDYRSVDQKISQTNFENAIYEPLPDDVTEDNLTYEPFGDFYFKCRNPTHPHYFDAENYVKFCRHSLEDEANISCAVCPIDKTFEINPQVYTAYELEDEPKSVRKITDIQVNKIIYFSRFLVELTKVEIQNDKILCEGVFLPTKPLEGEGIVFKRGDKLSFTVQEKKSRFKIRIQKPYKYSILSKISIME
jgi:hypothetical protein